MEFTHACSSLSPISIIVDVLTGLLQNAIAYMIGHLCFVSYVGLRVTGFYIAIARHPRRPSTGQVRHKLI